MRASILVLGPILASLGSARVPLPGGCAIGARPIDLHLFVMESLGANIKYDSGFIIASVGSEGLKGGVIDFPKISVGATESAIMTAVLAKGVTKIKKRLLIKIPKNAKVKLDVRYGSFSAPDDLNTVD